MAGCRGFLLCYVQILSIYLLFRDERRGFMKVAFNKIDLCFMIHFVTFIIV